MKKFLGILLTSALAISLSQAKSVKLKEPPEELSKYYPPESENYEFLVNMYQLSTAFTGVMVNAQEGKWSQAKEWAKRTKEYYVKIGKLVPSWKKVLRIKSADNLIEATEAKKLSDVKKYANIIGKTCVQCHKNYQLPTKIKYHYPSYDGVAIEDPVEEVEYSVKDYMKKMTNDMKLIKVYITQQDKEKASEAGERFIKRFEGLQQMCSDCHTNNLSEEVYFNDEIKDNLETLKDAIENNRVNETFSALNQIGWNNCTKCHNVHQVPAMLKEKFEK
ncbi:MAG: hypothetical protein GXO21_00460 [Aquificae bacterium]|nr:hypothetical protein [Aquificota bacterium]